MRLQREIRYGRLSPKPYIYFNHHVKYGHCCKVNFLTCSICPHYFDARNKQVLNLWYKITKKINKELENYISKLKWLGCTNPAKDD